MSARGFDPAIWGPSVFALAGSGARADEVFANARDLSLRILDLAGAPAVWLGDCHLEISALGPGDDVARPAVIVRKTDGAGGRGDFLGIALMPVDPARGSFGARDALRAALRRAVPGQERAGVTPALGARQTALAIGMAHETFRKRRRDLARTLGFPAPIREARPLAWRPEEIEAWLAARRRALGGTGGPAANDDDPGRAHRAAIGRVQRQRAAVAGLMEGGR